MVDIAQHTLTRGEKFPYDANDAWWAGRGDSPPPSTDWAHAAARGVIADLKDRRGIKHGFNDIDEGVRAEIVDALANIIRAAASRPRDA
jgi:hypothetical protein